MILAGVELRFDVGSINGACGVVCCDDASIKVSFNLHFELKSEQRSESDELEVELEVWSVMISVH